MFQWLRRILGRPTDTRALSVQDLKNLVYGPPTQAGVAISEEMALGLSAMWRGVDLISSNIASLDADVFRQTTDRGKILQPKHPVGNLIADPNDELNKFKFWRTYIMHVVCAGNGFAEIERANNDQPIALHIVHWRNVRVLQKYEGGPIVYHLIREDKVLEPRDILHTTSLSWNGIIGMSPIRAMRETLGLSVAQERWIQGIYGHGATPWGILKVNQLEKDKTGVVGLTPEMKANIRDAWNAIYGGPESSGKVGILPPGTEWIETNMTPADQAFILSRTFQIEEVSRILGIPSNLLFSGNQQSYNSNEENNTQFYQLGLRPILENLEAEIDTKLVSREERLQGVSVKFNVKELNKGNYERNVNAETRLVLTGVKTQNEAREALGLNPIPGFDDLLVPTNLTYATDLEKETIKGQLESKSKEQPSDLQQQKALSAPQPLADAVREAFKNEVSRALRRHQKAPDKDQRAYLVEALAPTFRAYALANDLTLSVNEYADRWMTIDPNNATPEVLIELSH